MKTIEQVGNEAYLKAEHNAYFVNGFKAGVEFAQRWIPVEEELPKKLVQVIVKLENGWHTCTWITENGDFAFNVKPTHWRYIDIE